MKLFKRLLLIIKSKEKYDTGDWQLQFNIYGWTEKCSYDSHYLLPATKTILEGKL